MFSERKVYCTVAMSIVLFGLFISFHRTSNPLDIWFGARDKACKRHDCNGNGTCLIGKCFCRPGYEGADCEVLSSAKVSLQCTINDDSCFIHPIYGVGEISLERWKTALYAEYRWWMQTQPVHDRRAEHLAGFGNYSALPYDLGNTIEIGCGPYTQVLSILNYRGKLVNVNELTLWDPNVIEYITQVKQCSYKNGTLEGYDHIPTTIIVGPSEKMRFPDDTFDTIVMINVLEHVQNAYQILQNIYNALKTNGVLIFGERWWDLFSDKKKYPADVLHPIRITYVVWQWFTSNFITLYDARNHYSFLKHNMNGSYFIGRKRSLF